MLLSQGIEKQEITSRMKEKILIKLMTWDIIVLVGACGNFFSIQLTSKKSEEY